MEWTDKRMDDLAKRVDDGFAEVKSDIARLDAKIGALQTLLLRFALGTTAGLLASVVVITIRVVTSG